MAFFRSKAFVKLASFQQSLFTSRTEGELYIVYTIYVLLVIQVSVVSQDITNYVPHGTKNTSSI